MVSQQEYFSHRLLSFSNFDHAAHLQYRSETRLHSCLHFIFYAFCDFFVLRSFIHFVSFFASGHFGDAPLLPLSIHQCVLSAFNFLGNLAPPTSLFLRQSTPSFYLYPSLPSRPSLPPSKQPTFLSVHIDFSIVLSSICDLQYLGFIRGIFII